ncbi:unnamed protein product [Thelazia callipaeda]|uniref:CAP-Gly domain-containing protein n=1 Tax=Thelazia callipaeda TaxID=103827 RepID=A0A0N5CXY5_THECL|nr:unnamed protein product [Thelazia callipaeda]
MQIFKVSFKGATISKKDVGKRVIVGRVGAGTLRYVGKVEGKEGIFCGIELDQPEGKHNGTYQGIAYFHCTHLHGIFAPSYKVELLEETKIFARREEKLMRSAMAAISAGHSDMMRSTAMTSSTSLRSGTPSMDISMASVSTLGSSNIFDHSMVN